MTETSGREKRLEEAWDEYANEVSWPDAPTWQLSTKAISARRTFEAGYDAALASPSTQEPALRGGKVEEIAAIQWTGDNWREVYDFSRGGDRNLARVYGPHPDDSINIDTADGMKRVPKGDLVVRFRDGTLAVGSIAAALRTYAGESAAQSERAGLERAAAWHEEQAKRSWQGSAKLPDYECHVKSAKAIRALSAARKAGG